METKKEKPLNKLTLNKTTLTQLDKVQAQQVKGGIGGRGGRNDSKTPLANTGCDTIIGSE